MKTTPPRAPTRLKRPTTRCFAGCCLCFGYSGNWPRRKKHRRLYAKELVMHNFVGLPADQLLERMVELSLRTEEHL